MDFEGDCLTCEDLAAIADSIAAGGLATGLSPDHDQVGDGFDAGVGQIPAGDPGPPFGPPEF